MRDVGPAETRPTAAEMELARQRTWLGRYERETEQLRLDFAKGCEPVVAAMERAIAHFQRWAASPEARATFERWTRLLPSTSSKTRRHGKRRPPDN